MGLPAPLTDPWFEARFFAEAEGTGTLRWLKEDGTAYSFAEAQGVMLWCPCGYGKPEFPLDGARPHMILVPFRDRGVPETFGPEDSNGRGTHPRWAASGSSLADLTTDPSISVGKPECWHSYITNGMVR